LKAQSLLTQGGATAQLMLVECALTSGMSQSKKFQKSKSQNLKDR